MNVNNDIWEQDDTQTLARALAVMSDTNDVQNFLRDVMTEKEIIEISARLRAATMLSQGKKYSEIIVTTKLSSRTVARISDWLQNGCSGYQAALKTINIHHDHLSPARAE